MTAGSGTIWVHLGATPLLWLAATLLAYRFACQIQAWAKFNAMANPVAMSVAILVLVLKATGTPYQTYFDGAQFVHFLLGPATVALAIPLYQQIDKLRRHWLALVAGVLAGGGTAIATAMAIGWVLGASPVTILSLAPKSVTMPIAIGIAGEIGGVPSLTSAFVMLTGILGTVVAPGILDRMNIADDRIRGFALGVAAHGIGTSRAFQHSQEMGAFAGLAMGLSGMLTALILPFMLRLLGVL
jgi:predicted murein hydrolase (TIGR00659 family)